MRIALRTPSFSRREFSQQNAAVTKGRIFGIRRTILLERRVSRPGFPRCPCFVPFCPCRSALQASSRTSVHGSPFRDRNHGTIPEQQWFRTIPEPRNHTAPGAGCFAAPSFSGLRPEGRRPIPRRSLLSGRQGILVQEPTDSGSKPREGQPDGIGSPPLQQDSDDLPCVQVDRTATCTRPCRSVYDETGASLKLTADSVPRHRATRQ